MCVCVFFGNVNFKFWNLIVNSIIFTAKVSNDVIFKWFWTSSVLKFKWSLEHVDF